MYGRSPENKNTPNHKISVRFMNKFKFNINLPEWVRMWMTQSLFCVNERSHWVHLNGRSPERNINKKKNNQEIAANINSKARMFSYYLPVWVLRWFFNVANALKRIGQCSHAYGRSPVCIRLCLTIELDVVNPDPQSSHINGCSPVCFLQEDTIRQLLMICIAISCWVSLYTSHVCPVPLCWRMRGCSLCTWMVWFCCDASNAAWG